MNDNVQWLSFSFPLVFKFERGKRLITLDQILGEIAYISSTKKNNGIDNYITPPDYMQRYQNAITLNNSGSVGYCFYHPYEFVCSDHCTVIEIRDKQIQLNQFIALFLKPIIESIRSKYNFVREISDSRLNKEYISLPADESGQPFWQYMENTIRGLSNSICFNKTLPNEVLLQRNNEPIDNRKWKEFKLV